MANSSALQGQPKPILVQVLAYAPTQFFHCQHCEFVWQQVGAGATFHQEQLESSIPDDLKKEYADLSAWLYETVEAYGGRVTFKVIDAASVEGLVKSVRYGTRHYPAFVVEGAGKFIGTDFGQVRKLIENRLAAVRAASGSSQQ